MTTETHRTGTTHPRLLADRAALAWLLGGVLLGAFILGRWIIEVQRVPDDADFAAASRYLHGVHKKGDAVAVAPSWALRALTNIGDLDPTFGDDLVEHPPVATRLWVLAEPEGVATLDGLAERYQQIERKRFGKLQLAGFELGSQRRFDLVDRFADLEVFIDSKTGRVDCDHRVKNKWSCAGRPDWQRVSAEWLDVDFRPRKVLWAHPPPAGERLHLRLGEVPFAAELQVLAGNTVHGAQSAKAPVQVRVRIDDNEVATLSFAGYPLQIQRVDTSRFAGGAHRLELIVFTNDNGANHFALDAQIATH